MSCSKLKGTQLLTVLSHVVVSVALLFGCALIAWQLLTEEYPTHSDVFWMGVEFGALVGVFLVCLLLVVFFLLRSTMLLHKLRS